MCFYFTYCGQTTLQNGSISVHLHQVHVRVSFRNFFRVKFQYVPNACLVCLHYQRGGLNQFPQALHNCRVCLLDDKRI